MSRPYNTDGMTTALWMEIPPTILPINLIKPSQGYVSVHFLVDIANGYKGSYSGDEYPHVVLSDEIYWLEDGHHRFVAELLRGNKEIAVRIYKAGIA